MRMLSSALAGMKTMWRLNYSLNMKGVSPQGSMRPSVQNGRTLTSNTRPEMKSTNGSSAVLEEIGISRAILF